MTFLKSLNSKLFWKWYKENVFAHAFKTRLFFDFIVDACICHWTNFLISYARIIETEIIKIIEIV